MIVVSYSPIKASHFCLSMTWGIIIFMLAGDYIFLALFAYILLHGFEFRREI